jgi:hypothetical protein
VIPYFCISLSSTDGRRVLFAVDAPFSQGADF